MSTLFQRSLTREKLLLKLRVNGKPAFADEGQEYACNFCPVRLSSETDLLEHCSALEVGDGERRVARDHMCGFCT